MINTVDLRSWDDLISALREPLSAANTNFYYRGQSNPDWHLTPTFQRKYPTLPDRDLFVANRDEYLRAFRDHAHGLPGFPSGLAELDKLLTLGRHHGLITPILDWTRSPYVAAFFALRDSVSLPSINMPLDGPPDPRRPTTYGPADIAIWRLQIGRALENVTELKVFTEVGFENMRQKAQQCVYTHLDTHEFESIERLLVARGLGSLLTKFVVRIADAVEATADLARMNIHIATMFPDLAHAAQHANNILAYPDVF
jgi:hypothetical protein